MHKIEPISQTGHTKLKEELAELEVKAAELRIVVAEAREQGDLKENAEYIYGRQNLGFLEGRMGEVRGKLNYSKVVDCSQVPCNRVAFGTVVTLLDQNTQKKIVYHLLGPYDSDLTDDSISIHSPIGEALLDHVVGDTFSVKIPRGEVHFELLNISPSPIQ